MLFAGITVVRPQAKQPQVSMLTLLQCFPVIGSLHTLPRLEAPQDSIFSALVLVLRITVLVRADVRHVRGVRPNRAADFRGPPFFGVA